MDFCRGRSVTSSEDSRMQEKIDLLPTCGNRGIRSQRVKWLLNKVYHILCATKNLWATSRSRVPVDGAAIASDVRESSCQEQKRRRGGTRRMNDVGCFFRQGLKKTTGHPKAFSMALPSLVTSENQAAENRRDDERPYEKEMERLRKFLAEVETDEDPDLDNEDNGHEDVLKVIFSHIERFCEHDTESEEDEDCGNE
ncbi:hypothetical protein AVEN_89639-1 [Araneus ventricosus]|uniref:Uncharacterized protein n=1 Tax=Araneus ventricosus TaxID=182803 RepID=A0A4Y2ETU0_ARAVE|nr:hypothetical protein AVEN_89639-1 [Araneus ventricosus]